MWTRYVLCKKLARGDNGTNLLEFECWEHDIAYSNSNDLNIRPKADKLFENHAWERAQQQIVLSNYLII